MAFNPTTGHLLLVHRDPPGSVTIYILDATTGADVGTLPFQDVTAGNPDFKVNMIEVGSDGSIYAGNLSSSTVPPQFVLYRAASESDTLNLVYGDDPSHGAYLTNSNNRRWGDTLALRGTGTGTQVVLGTQSGNAAAILTPTDSSLTEFVATTLITDSTNAGQFGFGMAFGAGSSYWAKSASSGGNPLIVYNYNTANGTSARAHTYPTTVFPGRVGPLAVNLSSNLLAGIESISGKDRVRLYDISNLANPPVLLDQVSWPTNAAENNLFAGSLAFGTNSAGDPMLWALDTDNGLMAYSLVDSNHTVSPTIFLQPVTQFASAGSNVTFAVGADGIPAPAYYQWYYNASPVASGTGSSLTLSNLSAAANNGSYTVVVSNSVAAVTSSVARLTVVGSATGLIGYEPFDYTAGILLSSANPVWVVNGSGNDVYVAQGNLTVPGLPAPIGNSITNGGAGAGLRYNFPSSVIDGEIYYSFAMRIDYVGPNFNSTNSFVAAFVDGGSTYAARVVPRTNAFPGQFNLGVAKVGTTFAAQAWATNDFLEGQTIFIVVRYAFNPAGNTDDVVDMWINPSPSDMGTPAAPPATLNAPITGTDISLISQFTFRQNTAANTPAAMTFDELRIGRTWASVTPTPSVSVSLSIAHSGSSAVLSWPTNSPSDFALQSIGSLVGDPDGWMPVATPVVVQGTNNTVTINPATGRKFYRLAR
jgi:hypothetical protein